MMYFLTSSPCVVGSPALNPVNGFVEELQRALPKSCAALFICSDPDAPSLTCGFAEDMRDSFRQIGVSFTDVQVLERSNQDQCAELIAHSGLIFLAGGHVPTQNAFFQEISLREHLQSWDGVIIGVSAGSMNSADVVYAQPEEPGEAVDPDYQKFLPGLGLTKYMTIPHYNQDKDWLLDGMRLYDDITYGDSMGHRFYVLVDGSFILGRDGREELRGEAYLIEDGVLTQISREGETIQL
ncbi:MAG: Type 1 glutamine amidotransferase-like domain-containing protein [Oscillospiraceae bacterium]|nr:Type 1 glutamine amidotransferase-like domain-containing protein [Oscillospiraceae bacterium]